MGEGVVIEALDAEGKPLSKEALGGLFLLDLGREPIERRVLAEEEGRVVFEAPGMPFVASIHFLVPGFGEVRVYADNEGRGHTAADSPLLLNLELAKSRLALVGRLEREWGLTGRMPPEYRRRMERARSLLSEAEGCLPDRGRCAVLATESLSESLWAGELLALEKARRDIDRTGKREGFLFGCNFFRYPEAGEEYAGRFAAVFNFATLPLYWRAFEPKEGEIRWELVDSKLPFLEANGIVPKGHPLVWFHRAGVPDWVEGRPYEEVRALLRRRIREIVSKYRGRIKVYDVINEAHDWANILGYSQEQLVEMTALAAEETKAADPGAVRVVNVCTPFGEYVAQRRTYLGPSDRPLRSPLSYLKACIEAGVDFDVVGVQLYNPGHDMLEISLLLDRYGALGKPVHITELGVPSDNSEDERAHVRRPWGLWHAPWSEQVQADWVEQFYTICYSKPYIQAITWWDFADVGHFIPHGGFLRPDLTPKGSYWRLLGLLRSWGY